MPELSTIDFITEKIKFEPKGKARLKKWISESILKEKQQPGNICYVFCSDKYLLEFNKKYLQHNYFTDIITFDYTTALKKGSKKKLIAGDLFISIDRIKDNAKIVGTTFDEELRRVMIHGVLHLIGYSDKSPAGQQEIRKKENIYLKNYKTKKS